MKLRKSAIRISLEWLEMSSSKRTHKYEALMVFATALWGASYLFMKEGLADMNSANLLMWRLVIAFLASMLFLGNRLGRISKETLMISAVLGLLLFGCLYCITYGVGMVNASNASFLMGTSIIFVPFLEKIFCKRKISIRSGVLILVVLVGVWLLSVGDKLILGKGDLICMLAAFIRAIQIIVTDKYIHEKNALQIGVLQLGFAATIAATVNGINGSFLMIGGYSNVANLLAIGILCTAVGFILQCKAQSRVKPVTLSVIFTMEPVFTLCYSILLFGHFLSMREFAGAALILVGVVLIETEQRRA